METYNIAIVIANIHKLSSYISYSQANGLLSELG